MVNEEVMRNLNFLVKEYDGLNKMITSTKNRLHHLNPEAIEKQQDIVQILEALKGTGKKTEETKGIPTLETRMAKELKLFPIWSEWLKKIKGVGPSIGAHLLTLYYPRWVVYCPQCKKDLPDFYQKTDREEKKKRECPECGTKIKGSGIFPTRMEIRDFSTVSRWWSYMGKAIDPVTGRIVRKTKGQQANWSSEGKALCFHLGEEFVRQRTPGYRDFYDELKEKGRHHDDAKNRAVKLFLSHFWTVARSIDGLPVSYPYPMQILGHTGLIMPFGWDKEITFTRI